MWISQQRIIIVFVSRFVSNMCWMCCHSGFCWANRLALDKPLPLIYRVIYCFSGIIRSITGICFRSLLGAAGSALNNKRLLGSLIFQNVLAASVWFRANAFSGKLPFCNGFWNNLRCSCGLYGRPSFCRGEWQLIKVSCEISGGGNLPSIVCSLHSVHLERACEILCTSVFAAIFIFIF